jgi:hypothetical protein
MSLFLRAAHHFQRHRRERHILATVGVLDSSPGVLNRYSLILAINYRPVRHLFCTNTRPFGNLYHMLDLTNLSFPTSCDHMRRGRNMTLISRWKKELSQWCSHLKNWLVDREDLEHQLPARAT